jgi:hypothetical protein
MIDARKEELKRSLERLRVTAHALSRTQRLYVQMLESIDEDERSDEVGLDRGDPQVVHDNLRKANVWQHQAYSYGKRSQAAKRGKNGRAAARSAEPRTVSALEARLIASIDDRRQALKLRRHQERLRVMHKLVELQRSWERELECVQDIRDLVPEQKNGARSEAQIGLSASDLHVSPRTRRDQTFEARSLAEITRLFDSNLVNRLKSQPWYAENAAKIDRKVALLVAKVVPRCLCGWVARTFLRLFELM